MPNRIFLLDTMSFIYRAYHAAAHQPIVMTTRAGFPTGATYIFCNMLRKLFEQHSPEHMVAVCDSPGETFRERLSADYKANRRGETPPDLVRQLPNIWRAVDAYRLPRLAVAGYEADDLIGTLARLAEEADPEALVYIVSGDKDMLQLVDGRTYVINPMKDQVFDPAKVEEKVGVRPELVVDVMALRGDAADNVPGAPGVGEKGSVAIIRQFGSLEAALDGAAEIKRKQYRESLQNNRERILLSKRLVTIVRDVPGVGLDAGAARTPGPDKDVLAALYGELEFASLLRREGLGAAEDFAAPLPPEDVAVGTTMTEAEADEAIDAIL